MAPIRFFDQTLAQPKGYFEGTHRSCSPAETLAQRRPLMPRMGITRLANVTGLDHIGIPVFMCVRPNSRSLSVSQGKGLDPAAARASALMESIEGWHAEHFDTPSRYESPALLRRSTPIANLERLVRYDGMTAEEDIPMLWAEGHDLLRGERVAVPFEMVNGNFVSPPGAQLTFPQTTNGLASGNHLLEALVHAFCELIERDACALWDLDPKSDDTLLDPASVHDPLCRDALDRLARADMGVMIWDATSDLGIPTYSCALFDRPDLHQVAMASGSGCHLSPEVALLRAITEAVQTRLTFIAGSRDDIEHATYEASADIEDRKELWRDLAAARPARQFREKSSLAGETFEDDLATLLARLAAAGLDSAIAVDLSRPDIGIPVVKAIVPGLELDSEGFAAGERAKARLAALEERA